MHEHTSVPDVEVTLRCNGRIARLSPRAMASHPKMQTKYHLGGTTTSIVGIDGRSFGEFEVDLRRMNQRLASLEQNVWRPRLAVEADVPAIAVYSGKIDQLD